MDAGVNVVIVLFGNSTGYQPPQGNFNFIEVTNDDSNGNKNWKKLIINHPLFEDNPTVTVGTDKRRAILGKILCGYVDIVAEWED